MKRLTLAAMTALALIATAGAADAAKYHVDVLKTSTNPTTRICSYIEAPSFKGAFDACQRKFGLSAPAIYVTETLKQVCRSTHKVTLASNQASFRFVYDKRFSYFMKPHCP